MIEEEGARTVSSADDWAHSFAPVFHRHTRATRAFPRARPSFPIHFYSQLGFALDPYHGWDRGEWAGIKRDA